MAVILCVLCRYAFTVLANLSVFAIAYVILESSSGSEVQPLPPGVTGTTPSVSTLLMTSSSDASSDICLAGDSALQPSDLNKFRVRDGTVKCYMGDHKLLN